MDDLKFLFDTDNKFLFDSFGEDLRDFAKQGLPRPDAKSAHGLALKLMTEEMNDSNRDRLMGKLGAAIETEAEVFLAHENEATTHFEKYVMITCGLAQVARCLPAGHMAGVKDGKIIISKRSEVMN